MKAKVIKTGEIIEASMSHFSFDPDVETEYTDGYGNYYKESELEEAPEPFPKKEIIEGWIARDKSGPRDLGLRLYTVMPKRMENTNRWNGMGERSVLIDYRLFTNITWESEPYKAKIEITLY